MSLSSLLFKENIQTIILGVKLNKVVQPKKLPYQNNLQNEKGYCL